jgi:hypothetical protein
VRRSRKPRNACGLPDRAAGIARDAIAVVASVMADVTFRDFAGAIMKGDVDAAGRVLQQLLGLDDAEARTAAQHFQSQATAQGPAFMGKAMGLRTAVSGGSEAEIGALLADCFGLEGAPLLTAIAVLKPRPS